MKRVLAFCLIPLLVSAQSVQITGGVPAVSGVTTIAALSCSITTVALPAGTTGTAYSQSLATSNCNTPFAWSIVSGALPTSLSINTSTGQITGTPSVVGMFNFRVQLVSSSPSQTVTRDLSISISAPAPTTIISNSMCGVTGGGMDATAHLPNTYLCSSEADTPRSSPSSTSVSSGGDVLAAYNAASCGVDIQLAAGGTYTITGSTWPAKSCPDNNWIWIRTAPSGNLPAEGVTTNPCYSNVASLADYPNQYPCTSPVAATAKIVIPANNGSWKIAGDHIRIENVEIAKASGAVVTNMLTLAGANKLVLDRVWFHGNPGEDTARAISLDGSANVSIVESFLTDLHCTSVIGACSQGQAINAISGSGPYKISHNFISAGGELILFGGGGFTYGTPSDIEVSYNHGFKPFTWNPACTTSTSCPGGVLYNGGVSGKPYSVLNHFEVKNGQRILLFGDIWENNWAGFSQVGNSITLTPKSQAAGAANQCPLCVTLDITERFDLIKYTAQPFQLANVANGNGAYATAGNSYSFHDILATHGMYTGCYQCGTYLNEIITGLTAPAGMFMSNVTFNHITETLDKQPNESLLALGGPLTEVNLTITNSILPAGQYGIGNSGGTTNCAYAPAASVPKLTNCWNPMVFSYNMIPWGSGTSCAGHGCGGTWTSSPTPNTTILVADQNSVGFTNISLDNYLLTGGSLGHNAGSDGKDLGADISALNTAIANAPY